MFPSKDEIIDSWISKKLKELLDSDEQAIIGYLRLMKQKYGAGKFEIFIRKGRIDHFQPAPQIFGECHKNEGYAK